MEASDALDGYEKIRTVGKGAFGVAVLYKKKSNNQLVVLKEVNTIDLSPAEFEMAMNEVEVLSSLNHPNIIGYGGSFAVQGVLMIEMEYADGGTLCEFLVNRKHHIPEREILTLTRQIVSAIAYMHENNVLHRDLKTANVFMNTDGCVKIGDFGIAKVLNTNAQAQTVLGTPYYISPEMCEGKEYDEKSDMWAVGCILYEMCSLHKTFQASSLSALVNKIMLGKYKPIPAGYSEKLNDLVGHLLNKDPDKRPTAEEVYDDLIPDVISSLSDRGYDYVDPDRLNKVVVNVDRTVLYYYKENENEVDIEPISLPPKAKIISVSVGRNHYIAVTEDGEVFAWGEGSQGQLGLGELKHYTYQPQQIDSIFNKQVVMSRAGANFTLLLTKEGELLSFGDGSAGSLGHGDWKNYYKPKVIVSLLGVRIKEIASSSNHVAVLTMNSEVYTWGCGEKGQTGQTSLSNSSVPTKVEIQSRYEVAHLELGYEATMAIMSNGNLYACGCNNENKLSLYKSKFLKHGLSGLGLTTIFRKVHHIPKQVIKCSIGRSHCNIMVKLMDGSSAIFTTGSLNPDKNDTNVLFPYKITSLNNMNIRTIKCGESCTILGTDDNCVLFLGLKYKHRENSFSSSKSTSLFPTKSFTTKNKGKTPFLKNFIGQPTIILGLYSSQQQIRKKSFITLVDVYPLKYDFMFLIRSSTPLKANKRDNEPEIDDETMQSLPTWIKNDIELSEFPWNGSSTSKYK